MQYQTTNQQLTTLLIDNDEIMSRKRNARVYKKSKK